MAVQDIPWTLQQLPFKPTPFFCSLSPCFLPFCWLWLQYSGVVWCVCVCFWVSCLRDSRSSNFGVPFFHSPFLLHEQIREMPWSGISSAAVAAAVLRAAVVRAIDQQPVDWTAAISLLDETSDDAGEVITAIGPVQKHPQNPLFGQDKPWEPRLDNGFV